MDLLKKRFDDGPVAHRGGRRGERGMAYLETVLVLPVVLLLILGLADFSFAFKDYLVAGNAAAEAVRTATLYQSPCVPGNLETNARNNAEDLLHAGGVEAAQITDIDIDHTQPGLDLCQPGMLIAEIDVRSELAFLGSMFPISFGPIDFTASATALNENGN
jgi:hypothetical protein